MRSGEAEHVILAFTIRDQGDKRLIRPISARHMHAKEVQFRRMLVSGHPPDDWDRLLAEARSGPRASGGRPGA